MTLIPALIFFALGLTIGSFLNVVIYRYNTERHFGGRSACLSCFKKLSWYELFPVLSFVWLRGRCRSCQARISAVYPVVEIITGLIFAMLFLKLENVFFADTLVFAIAFAYFATMFSILLVIAVYDLRHKIIPDMMVLLFGILAFAGLFLFGNADAAPIFYPHLPDPSSFMAGLVVSAPFALIWLLSRGAWMGLGDAKLAVGLGWLLGIAGIFSAAVLAFWLGAIVGIFLLIFSKKYGAKSEIPFAPFLVLASFLVFIFQINVFPIF
ncbi:hypothetical protein A3G06_02130 [Candidatus Nomurabacteria bacterium RIFCSPLOWO2_12_FULL_46_14]|uniref:Prepilin peptidase n=1 Tax=Candidatus Nomurabacteria bacterium RIFCSPLOWO2_12_FULL_46_14 TaxID=1801797 RepID=A0A1F6YD85_9BACT|nr:MAG: hypothetical protein A3G06_02130 [Candidatus Nomurabacteria bacterium RIFCSPLOWO2_12_FULL_46_14]